jgi:FkbM family methyltransferase
MCRVALYARQSRMRHPRRHFEVVQIGAHLAEESASAAERGGACLFVEAVPRVCDELRKRFAAFPNVAVENVAVAGRSGVQRIYYLRDAAGLPFWADQIGSLREAHIIELATQAGFDASYRSRLVSAEIRCLTLAELLAKHSISFVDTLIVDAEGADYEILWGFDFSVALVRRLVFERKHMDGVRKTGYRYNHLIDKLQQIGYSVRHLDHQNDEALLAVPGRQLRQRMREYQREQFLEDSPRLRRPPAAKLRSCRGRSSRALSRTNPSAGTTADTDNARGVIYLALGRSHFQEAQQSIASLRLFHPELPVSVFTDQPATRYKHATFVSMSVPRSPFKQKISALLTSSFQRTLYLDTDTAIVGSLNPLFDLLSAHEWCIAEAPRFRFDDGVFHFDAFQSHGVFNTGVIGFENNAAVQRFLQMWVATIDLQPDEEIRPGHLCDQWYFNNIASKTDAFRTLRVRVINNLEWNVRCYAIGQAARDGLLASARIIHARPWEVRQFWGMNLSKIVCDLQSGRAAAAPSSSRSPRRDQQN